MDEWSVWSEFCALIWRLEGWTPKWMDGITWPTAPHTPPFLLAKEPVKSGEQQTGSLAA